MISTYQPKKEKAHLIQVFVLFILLIGNIMVRTQYDIFDTIGDISINVTFVFMFVYLIKGYMNQIRIQVPLTNVYISIFLFAVVFSASYYVSERADAVYLLKLLLFLTFILGAIRTRWNPKSIKIAAHLLGITVILLFLHWVRSGFPVNEFQSIFRNANYLGVFLFVIWYFKILAIKYGSKLERVYFTLLMVLNLILIYSTSTRSVVIAAVVILFVWVILKQFRNLFPYLFYIVVILNVLFLFTYVKVQNTSLGMFLDNISVKLLDKSLFSGRGDLWVEIWQKVVEKPLFGYGMGTEASDITSFSLTAHNQYFQFLLEQGFIGLVVFLLLLFSIWKLLVKRLNYYPAKLSACFFLGILVYENFELTLFQNNYPIAFFLWLIMVIGINFETGTGSR